MDTSRKDEAGNALLLCYKKLGHFFFLGYMTRYLGKVIGPRAQRSEENPIFVAY